MSNYIPLFYVHVDIYPCLNPVLVWLLPFSKRPPPPTSNAYLKFKVLIFSTVYLLESSLSLQKTVTLKGCGRFLLMERLSSHPKWPRVSTGTPTPATCQQSCCSSVVGIIVHAMLFRWENSMNDTCRSDDISIDVVWWFSLIMVIIFT